MLFCEIPEHEFLVADAHTLIVAAIIQRDTAVESGDFLISKIDIISPFLVY